MTWKIVKSVGKSDLIRPTFAPGLLLQDDDLTQVVNYGRNTLQTLLSAMLGCGVLCGLRVSASFDACKHLTITIACGTALDCHGRVIDIPNPHTIQIENDCCTPLPANLYVSLFPADSACAPRELTGTALEGEGETAYTRIREGWQIHITDTRPNDACGCPETGADCYAGHKAGDCGCDCDCNGVLLAKIAITDPTGRPAATVNHAVRRFVRPALLADPLVSRPGQVSDVPGSTTPPTPPTPTPRPTPTPDALPTPTPAPLPPPPTPYPTPVPTKDPAPTPYPTPVPTPAPTDEEYPIPWPKDLPPPTPAPPDYDPIQPYIRDDVPIYSEPGDSVIVKQPDGVLIKPAYESPAIVSGAAAQLTAEPVSGFVALAEGSTEAAKTITAVEPVAVKTTRTRKIVNPT